MDIARIRAWDQQIAQTDLTHLDRVSFIRLFADFSRDYDQCWREAIFLDAFDSESDRLVGEALAKAKADVPHEALATLTSTQTPSPYQRERRDLIHLWHDLRRNPRVRQAILQGQPFDRFKKAFPGVVRKLALHARTYHWIRNDIVVMRFLTAEYFFKEFVAFEKRPSPVLQEEEKLTQISKRRKEQRRLAQRFGLKRETVHFFDFLSCASEMRDLRKSTNQVANAVLHRFARAFTRKIGWPLARVEELFWWQALALLRDPKKNERFRRIIERRRTGLFSDWVPDEAQGSVTGSRASALQKLMRQVTTPRDLRGMPTFPGTVRGVVRIIRSQEEFTKMRRGNIIVAPNTRPEYVPIMKLAGAVITEEGGVTSHAAIVARELHIPTIVGMQGALDLLQDGDRVEVDATKGIVRKL